MRVPQTSCASGSGGRQGAAFPLHLAESWGSTQSQLPAGPFPRGCALGRAPCSPWGCLQAVCEPWVPGITPRCQAGPGTAAWPGRNLNLPPAHQGTRDDPSFASVLWGSALFGTQPLVWGSALGVPAVPCSSSRVWGGLRGGILGHAARGGTPVQSLGSPMPDTWIPLPAKPWSLGPSLQPQPGAALSSSIPTTPEEPLASARGGWGL